MRGSRFVSGAAAAQLAVLSVLAATVLCPPASAQTNEWTWMSGGSTKLQPPGAYGNLGIAAPGNTPGGRTGTISWTDADGNFWLFGSQQNGIDGNGVSAYLDDVWEYTSNQEWTWVAGSKSVSAGSPSGCAICSAPPVFGTYQTPAAGNTPGGLQQPIHWVDKGGNLWIFGGFEYGSGNSLETMNALWEFNVSIHQWAWMGGSNAVNGVVPAVYGTLSTPDPRNTPGGRTGAVGWVDSTGNLWLFSGFGEDAAGTSGYLNDLWMFDTSLNEWTWMGGSNSTFSGPCVAQYEACSAPGVAGTLQTPAAGNTPQGRSGAVIWNDKSGNIWLFGGETSLSYNFGGISGFEGTFLNDLWKLDSNTHQWAWMSGIAAPTGNAPQFGNSPGVYGTLGVPSPTNTPGGRVSRYMQSAYTWIDNKGGLWLFSGDGFDSTTTVGQLNDVWMFDTSVNEWTWMGGSSTFKAGCITGSGSCSRPGVYGSLGVPATTNIPGGRGGAVQWTDPTGNLWLFAGWGIDSVGTWGYLNDLWEFNPSTNEWTWMSGSSTVPNNGSNSAGQFGIYGDLRVPAATNTPGGRLAAGSWIDGSGNLWAFGGDGCGASFCSGWLNDLWRYALVPPAAATPTFSLASGTYTSLQTLTMSDQTPGVTIYYTTDGTTPTNASNVYGAPITISSSETIVAIAAGSGYARSPVATAAYTLVLPAAAAPTFSPASGTYSAPQTVTLSDVVAGATIYFTTDGTTPTTASKVYSAPITVSSSETIEAIATASGYASSSVASAAYTINLPPPTFTLAASPTSLTIKSGSPGSTTLTIAPQNGFNAAVSFACSGVPANVSCSFSPSTVTPSGAAVSTQATMTVGAQASMVRPDSHPFLPAAGLVTAASFLFFSRRWRLRARTLLAILVMLSFGLTISACSGGTSSSGGNGGGSSQSYTVTLTATSGTMKQTATITLTEN